MQFYFPVFLRIYRKQLHHYTTSPDLLCRFYATLRILTQTLESEWNNGCFTCVCHEFFVSLYLKNQRPCASSADIHFLLHTMCFARCSVKGRISDARFTATNPVVWYRLGESYVALMLLLCSSYSGWEVYGCSRGGSQRQKSKYHY